MRGETAIKYPRNYRHQSSRRPCSGRNGSEDDHLIEEHLRNKRNQFAALNRSSNIIPQDKASGVGNVNDMVLVEHLNNGTSPQTDAIRRALLDKFAEYVTTDTTGIPQQPHVPSADINKVDPSSCTFPSCETVLPENANTVDVRLRNNIPAKGTNWETKGLKDGSNSPLKGGPQNMNDCSDLSVAKRSQLIAQGNDSSVTEPITGECEEPPDCSTDESASKSSDIISLPVSKNPTRGSLSQSKRRALALLQSSGCSNSSDGAGISCSTGSDNSGGYTGGRGSGGGTGQTGRGENGTGRRGGVSGRGDESGDVSGSGSGSGRGRGGRSSGGSGDSKKDKKGGGKKESSASGPRVRPQTGTLDSGLGAEKSTSDINTGTDVTNSVQGTTKLKNGSLLVPCEAQQQEPGALILPTLPLLAVGIPSSHLPSLPNAVSSSGSTPSVFVCPKKVAESYESPVQESPDYLEGGLPCLNLPLFPAASDFGLEPVVKPFSAGCGGESNFEDTDSLLTYASPALQSQYQPIGATSTISEESSDSLEIHADVGGCNNPPRRHFSPQPFFSIKETCGELPRTSLPPVREQESSSWPRLRLQCLPLPEGALHGGPLVEEFVGSPMTLFPR